MWFPWLQSRRNTGHTTKAKETQPIQTHHKSKMRNGSCVLSDVVLVAPVEKKHWANHKSHGNQPNSDTPREQSETRKLRFVRCGSRGSSRGETADTPQKSREPNHFRHTTGATRDTEFAVVRCGSTRRETADTPHLTNRNFHVSRSCCAVSEMVGIP